MTDYFYQDLIDDALVYCIYFVDFMLRISIAFFMIILYQDLMDDAVGYCIYFG